MEVIMHECCHFLYFEKWKMSYPKISHKKFESPYLEWHLSEIIAPIVLNDQRVNSLLRQKAFFYEEHEKIKINNKTAPEYFTELYNKNKNFEQFLNKSYKIIKKIKIYLMTNKEFWAAGIHSLIPLVLRPKWKKKIKNFLKQVF